MICPNCEYENNEEAKFCSHCGENIRSVNICPECHAENKPLTRFCNECGYSFSSLQSKSQHAKQVFDYKVILKVIPEVFKALGSLFDNCLWFTIHNVAIYTLLTLAILGYLDILTNIYAIAKNGEEVFSGNSSSAIGHMLGILTIYIMILIKLVVSTTLLGFSCITKLLLDISVNVNKRVKR